MTRNYRSLICLTVILVVLTGTATEDLRAQGQTLGLMRYDDSLASYGYTLLFPQRSSDMFLLDMYGRVVHTWNREVTASSSVYLLPDGTLLRGAKTIDSTGSIGRTIQAIDWDGEIVWAYDYRTVDYLQHHDIHPLPNGNVLILGREHLSREEAAQAGRDTSSLDPGDGVSPDYVVEVRPTGATAGEIVWEWHVWDHLIQDFDSTKDNYGLVEDHPELIDANYVVDPSFDWTHANAIAYNVELDQIILCVRHFHEVWVIDHSTTTEEAAGHTGGASGRGGDIIYRWGNPAAYRAGTSDDQVLFGPHDAQWIASGLPGEGNILVFNNGWTHPEADYSTVEEITPPLSGGSYPMPDSGEAHGPAEATWSFGADSTMEQFYSATISGTQRLPNGNTLICSGLPGLILEVTPSGDMVWEYQNPVAGAGALVQGTAPQLGNVALFRANRYPADYTGLAGQTLDPGGPLEVYSVTIESVAVSPGIIAPTDSVVVSATIHSGDSLVAVEVAYDDGDGFQFVTAHDDGLHHDGLADDSMFAAVLPPQVLGKKVWFYWQVETGSSSQVSDPVYADENGVYYSYTVTAEFVCGDVDGSGAGPDIGDLIYLVSYMFQQGAEPPIPSATDVDGSGSGPDIGDLIYLVNYMFQSGPALQCP